MVVVAKEWSAGPGGTWVPRSRHAGTSPCPKFPGPDAYPGPLPPPPAHHLSVLMMMGIVFFYSHFFTFMVNIL